MATSILSRPPVPRRHAGAGASCRSRALAVLLCAALAAAGCGGVKDAPKSVPIRGKVTLKGEPITSGEVVYTPVKTGEGRMARGGIGPDGTFQMRTSPSVPGVVPGEYGISLVVPDETASASTAGPSGAPVERPPPRHLQPQQQKATVPAKYLSPESSGLKETVDENHSGTTDIVLID